MIEGGRDASLSPFCRCGDEFLELKAIITESFNLEHKEEYNLKLER